VRYASPSTVRVLGYAPEAVENQSGTNLLHPHERERVDAEFAAFLRSPLGTTETFAHQMRHKNGSWRDIEGVATNLLEEPAVAALVVNYRDVTEKKRADDALRASEERFRLLVEGARDHALFLLDPAGIVTSWNVGAERIFGWTEAEMVGQSGSVIFHARRPRLRRTGKRNRPRARSRPGGRRALAM
jgi:PAS domain S-box-containing protein